jgi:hypothetical protein
MEPESTKAGRLPLARQAVRELLDLLENEAVPVERPLMKAQRLARLMRDEDAQRWLALELGGYPSTFRPAQLGTCQEYCWRHLPDGGYYLKSLPEVEAEVKAGGDVLARFQPPAVGGIAANYLESGATNAVIARVAAYIKAYKSDFVSANRVFSALKAEIHRFAADVSLALELGDVAEEMFDEARVSVDRFVRTCCPQAAEQLVAVNERLRESSPESWTAALTACRRLLCSVADAVFPAQTAPHVDGSGQPRKVGAEEYKNRILAFIQNRVKSDSSVAILAARLDAVNEKAGKGVHATVTQQEARLTVIETYLLVAEVARLWAAEPAGSRQEAAGPPQNPGT